MSWVLKELYISDIIVAMDKHDGARRWLHAANKHIAITRVKRLQLPFQWPVNQSKLFSYSSKSQDFLDGENFYAFVPIYITSVLIFILHSFRQFKCKKFSNLYKIM